MKTRSDHRFFFCVLATLPAVMAACLAQAAVRDRIVGPVDETRVSMVRGHVHPLAQAQFDRGQVDGAMLLPRMTLTFRPTPAQQADLDALLREQQDPASPNYHNWLSPAEYADRFGLSPGDVARVASWLQGRGFTVLEIAPSRTYVAFTGSVAQAQSAFRTQLRYYAVNGRLHYANAGEPSMPGVLASVVLGIHGLHDFRWKAKGVVRSTARPQFTSSITGNHFLVPDDFATIYNLKPLYDAGIDGTGQSLAVMGQTDIVLTDIQKFRSASGLPASDPQIILVPGPDPGISNNDIDEAHLDVEWAGAIAKNAKIIYVNSGTANGVFDSMQYAVAQNVAPVISISYGDCERNFSSTEINTLSAMGQQANAQGITILGPSGDSGAADCDFNTTTARLGLAVDIPAALPTVTGVGGTQFNEGSGTFWSATNNANGGSALSYIPEAAWNESVLAGGPLGTGGGVSKLFAKPTWQLGAGVPNDNARDVPDLALAAAVGHDAYLICSQGSCVNGFRAADNSLFTVGGTSASTPSFAGMVALINQKLNSRQGNVNPRLYQLAATTSNVFHDVNSGDNKVPCDPGSFDCPNGGTIGFSAGPGYDLTTGLGSVDANNLVNAFAVAAPTLTSLSPSTLAAGGAAFTLTANGANFVPGSTVQWNGSPRTTTFVSSTQLTAVITADDIYAPMSVPVTVINPPPGGGTTNALTFTVTGNNPVPALTSLSPGAANLGGPAFTLAVTGAGFVPSSLVRWNGANRTTTFVSSTQLTAAIPASDIAIAGTASVTVMTPAPGGGTSGAVSFFVSAAGSFPLAKFRYWPHIVTGGGYVTKMTITNLTNAQNNVLVYFISQAGTTLQTSSYSLAGAGTVRFSTAESDRFGPIGAKWAIVNSQADVGINLFFEIEQSTSSGITNTLGFNDSPPLTDFTLPVEFQPQPAGAPIGRTIGIALANTTNTAGTVTLKLIDQNGNILATNTQSLGPFAQTAIDLQLSVPAFAAALPAANFIGSLSVSSTVAISAIGLEDDLGPFSALPPIPGRAK